MKLGWRLELTMVKVHSSCALHHWLCLTQIVRRRQYVRWFSKLQKTGTTWSIIIYVRLLAEEIVDLQNRRWRWYYYITYYLLFWGGPQISEVAPKLTLVVYFYFLGGGVKLLFWWYTILYFIFLTKFYSLLWACNVHLFLFHTICIFLYKL